MVQQQRGLRLELAVHFFSASDVFMFSACEGCECMSYMRPHGYVCVVSQSVVQILCLELLEYRRCWKMLHLPYLRLYVSCVPAASFVLKQVGVPLLLQCVCVLYFLSTSVFLLSTFRSGQAGGWLHFLFSFHPRAAALALVCIPSTDSAVPV